jgi:ribosomal protein S14
VRSVYVARPSATSDGHTSKCNGCGRSQAAERQVVLLARLGVRKLVDKHCTDGR